jgi:AcrR family transcriptional regulator
MSPRTREAADAIRLAARARILEAAAGLFAERGYFACRVADVAQRAGMSPANVYWHFDSKEALLGEIVTEGLARLESMTAEVAAEYGPARRKLEILVERTIALYEQNARFPIIVGALMGDGGRQLLRSLGIDLADVTGRYHANLRRVLAEARSEGAIAPADLDLLVSFYFAFFNGLVISYAERWPALPREAVRDAALRVIGYRVAG